MPRSSCGQVQSLTFPNKPAAVCLANRAAMHLKAGRPEDALEDAKQATVQCPEYLKGHYRVGQALRALGHTAEADVVEGQIRTYRALVQLLPWYGLALLMLGWISQVPCLPYEGTLWHPLSFFGSLWHSLTLFGTVWPSLAHFCIWHSSALRDKCCGVAQIANRSYVDDCIGSST